MIESVSRSKLVPLIVSCALFMENLDGSIIATALPTIAQSLGSDPLHLNLAITMYLLGVALFIPLSGWAADRFGARTIFRTAIALFTLSSVLCGLAQSLPHLVLARLLQGIAGAMMMPVGRMVLFRTVPKNELISALAWLTIPALIGPMLGPPLGGFIVTYWSWRWIFLINVPIGIIGFVLVSLHIKNLRGEKIVPLDLMGFVILSLGLASLVMGFETTGRHMISNLAVGAMVAIGLALVALFLWHAKRVKFPIVDLSIFETPTFFASIVGGSLFRIGIGVTPFLTPLLLQVGFGFSPLKSGLLILAGAVGMMGMKPIAKPIIRRFGFRRLLIGNAALSSALLASYVLFDADMPVALMAVMLFLAGFSRSLQYTGMNALTYADMPERKVSRATTLFSMAQQLSLSLGTAVGAFALSVSMAGRQAGEIGVQDFEPALLGAAFIASLSIWLFVRLAPDAGAEVSGHRKREIAEVAEEV